MNPFSAIESIVRRLPTSPGDVADRAQWVNTTGRNLVQYLRHGGIEFDEVYSPYEVVASGANYALRRYFPDDLPSNDLPVLVFVPPLMVVADVYDASQRSGPVRAAHDNGIDVWVVDFGRPEEVEGGLRRTVSDYVLALSEVVDHVRRITGRRTVLSGYSQGGLFSYLAAAYRECDSVDSIVAFGSSVDWHTDEPVPIPMSRETYSAVSRGLLESGIFGYAWLPNWFTRYATKLTDPVKNVEYNWAYVQQMHERERLLANEQQRRFLAETGWTAYPGPALEGLLDWAANNSLMTGGMIIGDRAVSLADLDCPIMIAVGEVDSLGLPLAVRAIQDAAPRAQVYELTLNTGHFGIISSSAARRNTWPHVLGWLKWRVGQGDLPDVLVAVDHVTSTRGWTPGESARRIQRVGDAAIGAVRTAYGAVVDVVDAVQSLVPAGTSSDVSFAAMWDEVAQRDPDGVGMLFDKQALRNSAINESIDHAVGALAALGVRHGDRVGVLITPSPSLVITVAAACRIGAAAVLLRPKSAVADARAAGVSIAVADPEFVPGSAEPGTTWVATTRVGNAGTLAAHTTVLDEIRVKPSGLPVWYQRNPLRGNDPVLVYFTGDESVTHVVTSRAWARAASRAAEIAGLSARDTMYVTGGADRAAMLLLGIGSAVEAGARLGFPSAPGVDAFWAEVRRYGATCVAYEGSSLDEIAVAPLNPGERHHPIKRFLGSGLSLNTTRRVYDRFQTALVHDIFVTEDGAVLLTNSRPTKLGCAGRPASGMPDVRVVAYDHDKRRPVFDRIGLARECRVGEIGVLVAQCDVETHGDHVVHDLFEPNDAWLVTESMFHRDRDGDLWFAGYTHDLVRTAESIVPPDVARSALSTIASVAKAIVYGEPDGESARLVADLGLYPGADLTTWDIESALARIDSVYRPAEIRVTSCPATPEFDPVWLRRDDHSYEMRVHSD